MQGKRVDLNGVKVYPFASEKELLDFLEGKKKILLAVNAGKIYRATDEIRRIAQDGIGYVDGVGAQIALKKKGYADAAKIPGCELWLKIIEKFYKDKTFYLVGGKQAVIDQVVVKLETQFSGIRILNYRNGYFSSEEEKRILVQDVVDKKPDVVFVAMGSPNQELLMEEMYSMHQAVYQGLGGSFDVYVGNFQRAPRWWIDHNLEGVYRFLHRIKDKNIRKRFWSDLSFVIKVYMGKY